ncbi:tigger transposable element-derived protein 4 [Plakobranchus ocellatus]|uniref:Tigger transposable element-derived protein 4 n=1 Tax=Plakobranchus ocellatus TaxID=259542 RepID=A0AAV4CJB8_9GAST|nr:tigger transposable element-derived protein 4 [Plakobranchus ocellatus]
MCKACLQHGDLRLSGPSSSQGVSGGARTRNRRVSANFKTDSYPLCHRYPRQQKMEFFNFYSEELNRAKVIEEVENKAKTKAQISRDFEILSATLCTFLKDKDAIMSALTKSDFLPDRKRLKTTGYENLDRCLHTWSNQARTCKSPISGPIWFD